MKVSYKYNVFIHNVFQKPKIASVRKKRNARRAEELHGGAEGKIKSHTKLAKSGFPRVRARERDMSDKDGDGARATHSWVHRTAPPPPHPSHHFKQHTRNCRRGAGACTLLSSTVSDCWLSHGAKKVRSDLVERSNVTAEVSSWTYHFHFWRQPYYIRPFSFFIFGIFSFLPLLSQNSYGYYNTSAFICKFICAYFLLRYWQWSRGIQWGKRANRPPQTIKKNYVQTPHNDENDFYS